MLNRLLSYFKLTMMSYSGKNNRTKWRYIAPKITPNEAGPTSSIRENRPIKFSPPKSDGSSQQHSFLRREQLLHEIHMKRSNFQQNSLYESRQQLSFIEGAPFAAQAIASIINNEDGQLIKQSGFQSQDEQAISHGLCSCLELKQMYNLVRQIKESFLQFQKQILGQIKIYEDMFKEQVSKIYQFIHKYCNDHKETRAQTSATQTLAKIYQQPSDILQQSFETPKQAQKVEMSKVYQTESRLIIEVPQKQIVEEIQVYQYKSFANFDRFFEIMQAMRDTLDRPIVSMGQSLLSIIK